MSVIYVIPIDVHLPEYPADDAAEGDELELVTQVLAEAAASIRLAGVTVRVGDPRYQRRV
jgi:hypothetical protein